MIIILHQHIYKAVILVGLIFFLTTCSSTRLIYTFVDKFIKDEISYFLYLDEEEEVLLNQQVTQMVEWHRSSMLPRYATYITDIVNMLEVDQFRTAHITKALAEGRSLIEETVTGVTPYASKFLIRYQTVEAIEFIEKRMLMRRHERIVEMSKPKNLLYEERLDRVKLNFKRFLGDLNDAQVILIKAHVRATINDSRIRLHNRTVRQKVFIRFLRTKPTENELTAYLNKLLLRGHLITNPSYKIFSESSLDRFRELLVNILEISSKKQRETIISKLQDYVDDFNAISKL